MATATRPETIPDGYQWDDVDARLVTGIASEMNEKGDTRITWDKYNDAEVEHARTSFNRLTKEKNFRAFKVGRNDAQGERVDRFDPDAERLIFVPQYQGG